MTATSATWADGPARLAKRSWSLRAPGIAGGDGLGKQLSLVASDVTAVVLKDTGHWVLDERPAETAAALERFLR